MTRPFFRHLPIATKLRVIITVACIVVVFLTCIALALIEWFDVRTQMVNTLITRGQILSANAAASVIFNSQHDAEEVLGALRSDPFMLGGTIFRADGTMFAQYQKAKSAALPPPPGDAIAQEVSARHATVWVPMRAPDGHMIGTMALRRSMEVLYARFRLYALTSVGVMLAVTLFAFLLSHRLQQLISQPVLALAAAADRVTEGKDFSVRVARVSDDEIGRLATAFNSMLATIQAGEAESARLYEQVRAYAIGLEARVKERTAQLQNAYEEMESFSYSVSHDMRGPLRRIASYTEMLLKDNQGNLTPDSQFGAERILLVVQKMDGLINALLDFARLTKKEPVLEPVDITKMAQEIVAELRPESGNPEALVTVERMSICLADPVLLRQILANLLGNAFKYSRNRRPARITVSEVAIDGPEGRAYAVRDNGVGFDSRKAVHLFNAFVRLHSNKEFEGTGIGLAMVKRVLLRQGGRIWAESAVDAGATFFFTLARVEDESSTKEKPNLSRGDDH